MAQCTAIMYPNNNLVATPTNKEVANVVRAALVAGSANSPTLAPDATYTWTTAEIVDVTHAAATCNITLPDESATGLANWPVGTSRTIRKRNASANVIGFVALTNVGFNTAAVNTAITTLINSAVIPGIATRFPVWTIYRESAISYLFIEGA